MKLTDMERKFSDESPFDFSDLRAIYINCTLKRSPEPSNTQAWETDRSRSWKPTACTSSRCAPSTIGSQQA